MDNYQVNPAISEELKQTTAPKGIKTIDIKRMKRNGFSVTDISNKYGISTTAVNYHLAKKRKSKTTTVAQVRKSVNSAELSNFEAELFGTIIKLDRVPASIERIGNRIIIK